LDEIGHVIESIRDRLSKTEKRADVNEEETSSYGPLLVRGERLKGRLEEGKSGSEKIKVSA